MDYTNFENNCLIGMSATILDNAVIMKKEVS